MQVFTRISAQYQIDIASTIWTDNSGTFYVRRDLINEGTGAITVVFTDPSGSVATPGAGLRPLSTTDKDTITDFYDVLTGGTGYSVGDLLARIAILDVNAGTPTATFVWLNLSAGTILSPAPTAANIERANENVGARQIGQWNINNISGTISLPTGAATDLVLQAVRDRLPSNLVNGRLPVDGSAVTQPISAASLPLPNGAATDITLQQVRDAIKAQIDIASTIWTDNSGAFYVRRDLINEGTGAITVVFTDPSGNTATPGAGLRPLASTDKDVLTDFYDVLISGTGYSVGDLLSRVAIIDINSGTPSVTAIWINLTLGTILSSAPTSTNIERANENVGARQIGQWNINNISGTISLPNGAATDSTSQAIRDRLPTTLVGGRLSVDGSAVTQPISAASLPLPNGAATDITLQQVRDAIKAQIGIEPRYV